MAGTRCSTGSALLTMLMFYLAQRLENGRIVQHGQNHQTQVRKSSGYVAKQIQAISVLTDRKSTRLNSSHQIISYAVFCLKKKKSTYTPAAKTQQARPDVLYKSS